MTKIRYYMPCEKEYPRRLANCMDAPSGLYVRGELPRDDMPSVAIVGARMCSAYGKEQAYYFARTLAKAGVQIISGMARGIDGQAHRGALDAGAKTYAVLGCGADICYPKQNYDIYRKIVEQGGIVTEFPEGTKPYPGNFPRRNRIISGLADIVLVIEAREKSGSLITADFALEQGKTVYALPGRVGDVLSEGCNWLISQGASVALSPEKLLEELQILPNFIEETHKKNNFGLAREKEMVYSGLDLQPKSLSELSAEISLSVEEISPILIELELEGLVMEPMKNYYVKRNP